MVAQPARRGASRLRLTTFAAPVAASALSYNFPRRAAAGSRYGVVPLQSVPETTLRVRDLGEFGLLGRLEAQVDGRRSARGDDVRSARLVVGIGDDAAVWQPLDGARQVVTTDALIQDVHFDLSTTSWRDLGWKSAAVNVSDLAAMGAEPRLLLVTLGLPADALLADLLELYDGMLDLAAA